MKKKHETDSFGQKIKRTTNKNLIGKMNLNLIGIREDKKN